MYSLGIVTNYTEDKGRQGFSTGYRLAECQMHLVRSMKAALYNYSILGKSFFLNLLCENDYLLACNLHRLSVRVALAIVESIMDYNGGF